MPVIGSQLGLRILIIHGVKWERMIYMNIYILDLLTCFPRCCLAWEIAKENGSENKECRKHVASTVQNIDSASVSGSELMGGTIWGFHFDEFKISFS